MSNEMDSVGLLRSCGDVHHSNHEDRSGSRLSSTSVVEEDLGENSNASSGSNEGEFPLQLTASASGDPNGSVVVMSRAKDCRRSQGIMSNSSSTGHGHHHRHHDHSGSSHHHSRANYCQFETPADESRGTFPDDFDEELFINMTTGQLVESRNAPGQFDADEEMDSSNSHVHNSNHGDGLNLDTADHSESSDIEEMYSASIAVAKERAAASDAGTITPTSSRVGNYLGKVVAVTRRLSTSGVIVVRGRSNSLTEHGTLEDTCQDEPMNQDLNNCTDNDNATVIIRKRCLLVDESYNQDDTEDCVTTESEDTMEPATSFSTSMRKRKCVTDEPLPAKKAVTENPNSYSGLVPDPDLEPDENLHEDESLLASSPVLLEWLNIFASWNAVERVNAINHLIQASEPSEVRHMMRVIEPQFQRDFISLLPKELALYVLSFVEPKDLLQATQTCRYWRILCDDSLLWKEKCREAGIGPFNAMAQRIHNRRGRATSNPIMGMLGASRLCPASLPGASDNNCIASCEPWKAAYLRQHNVEMNWRIQPIKPAKTLKGHDDHVITCLQFSSNRIVSGSDDNTLKVWSATTGKCLRTLVGHTGGVWSSQMSGTTIVSGSTDRTLRVWNADTGACLHTLYGHTSTVRCMHLFERKVVSGSRDATLRVWNVDSGECLHVLVGHLAAVRCVQYNGKMVVSGAYDFAVRVWDVEREECLHQLLGHTNRVYSLQFDGIHVVSGSLDTSIRVWDVHAGTCKHTLMGHQSLTSGMELRENLLVSGNADSTVKIWDINTGQCLLTLAGPSKHLSAVTCLQLIDKFVITSSDDGTVKLWDIATGDFVRNLVSLSSGGSGGVVWRIRASETKLVCAVGSRNGTEETKLLVLDFDIDSPKYDDGRKDASTSTTPTKPVQCIG